MGWRVSVSWNAQNDATDVDVASPPDQEQPATSTAERTLVPLEVWRRRVLTETDAMQAMRSELLSDE